MKVQCDVQKPAVLSFLYISAISYAAHLFVALTTSRQNLQRERHKQTIFPSSSPHRLSVRRCNLWSVVVLFILGSINAASTLVVCIGEGGEMPEERRNFVILFAVSAVVITLLRGLILFVRAYIIWNHDKRVVVVPLILFLASTALGIYYIESIFGDGPEASPLTPFFVFWCLAMGLNITLTMLIAAKVHSARRAVDTISRYNRLSLTEVADIRSTYTSIISTLLKSAAVYSIVVTVGLIVAHQGGGIGFSFSSLVVQAECITSEFVIFRKSSTSLGGQHASTSSDLPNGG